MEAKDASIDDMLNNLIVDDTVGGLAQHQESTQQPDTMGGPPPVKTPLAKRPTNRVTPGSSGLTMYERSMIQKEERERKMKALQQKLMIDCTFTPSRSGRNSSNHSVVSSIGAGPGSVATSDMSVFSRLYHTETAASRGQKYHGSTRSNAASGWNTPRSVRSTPGRMFYSTPSSSRSVPSSPRLEELYRVGEERLRSRQLSDEEESRRLRERLEEQELKKRHVYTFHPRTKWNLAAERRRRAQKEAEIAASEARRSTPKMKADVSTYDVHRIIVMSILLRDLVNLICDVVLVVAGAGAEKDNETRNGTGRMYIHAEDKLEPCRGTKTASYAIVMV